ncbi:hypothetical protein B0T13DRAFT_62425 [Neurospora crassa]|nr:hypothetical protein B0T13DRAFT_62425 [Neurospora crassa]
MFCLPLCNIFLHRFVPTSRALLSSHLPIVLASRHPHLSQSIHHWLSQPTCSDSINHVFCCFPARNFSCIRAYVPNLVVATTSAFSHNITFVATSSSLQTQRRCHMRISPVFQLLHIIRSCHLIGGFRLLQVPVDAFRYC